MRSACLAVVLAVACAAAGAVHAATHEVTIEGMKFAPAELNVKRGDKVVFHNKDMVPHTATATGKFDSGNIAVGKSWSHTFSAAGKFDYVCTYHPSMKAVLTVQ